MAQSQSSAGAALGRLLFVDDDTGVRQSFSGLLRREGYDVDLAADGYAALEMLKHQSYDAVITDCQFNGSFSARRSHGNWTLYKRNSGNSCCR